MATKQEILDGIQAKNAETLADMAERAARRELHGDPAQWETREPLNEGQRQVRESYEQQIPVLPQPVQARWDAWCDARCKQMIESALGDLGAFLGTEMGKTDNAVTKLQDDIAELRKEMELRQRSTNIVDLPNPIMRKQQ